MRVGKGMDGEGNVTTEAHHIRNLAKQGKWSMLPLRTPLGTQYRRPVLSAVLRTPLSYSERLDLEHDMAKRH